MKYQLLERGVFPLGVAIQLEPYWQQATESPFGPRAYQAVGSEFKLIMDAALAPDRLFAALNVAYGPNGQRNSTGAMERESSLEVTSAISARLSDNVFLGAEIRQLTKYRGYFLADREGRAWFAGPSLYLTFGESAYAGIAWSVQVSGRAAEEPYRNMDLINYERHQLRLKVGFAF